MRAGLCQRLHQSSPKHRATAPEPHGRDGRARGQACPASAASEGPGAVGTSPGEAQRKTAKAQPLMGYVRSPDGGMRLQPSGIGCSDTQPQREDAGVTGPLYFLAVPNCQLISPTHRTAKRWPLPQQGSPRAMVGLGEDEPPRLHSPFFPQRAHTLPPPASFRYSLRSMQFSRLQHILLSLQLVVFLTSSAPVLGTISQIILDANIQRKYDPPFSNNTAAKGRGMKRR